MSIPISELPISDHSYIYVSIGAKENAPLIHYQYPPKKEITKRSNANFQLLPPFVRNRREPTLVICIEKDIQKNNSVAPLVRSTPVRSTKGEAQIYLYDTHGNLDTLTSLITDLTDRLVDFPKERVIIANFVRFVSPNEKEAQTETDVHETVFSILSKRNYEDRFYQWFGYQPNLYSLVFRPNHLVYSYMTEICRSLSNRFGEHELTIYTANSLLDDSRIPWKKLLPLMIDFVHTDEWNQSLHR